jgi:membrane protein YqaA with SNARE-associated domain
MGASPTAHLRRYWHGVIIDSIVNMHGVWIYLGLFGVAMLAATLVPMQSEVVLTGLLLAGNEPPAALVAVASVGNILGSAINWWLGRSIERYKDKKWFPIKPDSLARAEKWYHHYGRWSLLLSWAPIIGDPLTMIAGILREPLWSFLIIVAIAKIGRYSIIALVLHGLL